MPTLVYRYGLLAPTVGVELVDAQLRAAHRYYNTLIEIERWRRERYREQRRELAEIEGLEAWRAAAVDDLAAARTAIKTQRSKTRSRSDTAEQRERVIAARDYLREISALHRETVARLRDDAGLRAASEALNAEAAARVRNARATCGCYWGTYLIVEAAADAARKDAAVEPHFRRWDGSGAIGVQLQKGLTVAGALSCEDPRLQLDQRLQPCGSGKGKSRPRVRLRVGSEGRDPVWAEWPLILHRPLPTGAVIQWARVKRERRGAKDYWSLHLTLVVPAPRRSVGDCSQAVAVDIGWRRLGSGGLRVAYLVSEAGERREVQMDGSVLSGLKQVADLRAIRDARLNALQEQLVPWLRDHEAEIPEWLTEATQHLGQWRSPARFAALALTWRERQSDSLVEAYQLLEAWRKKDKHLWTWEVNLRNKVLGRRREQYRVMAAELAQRYRALVIERFDLRATQQRQLPESEVIDRDSAHAQQQMAAVSELRNCLVQAFARRGGVVAEMPSQWTTRTCHRCGAIDEAWDPAEAIEHRCTACGELADQDAQAADNLLRLWKVWCERSGGASDTGGARVTDHCADAVDSTVKVSKWGRLGRHTRNRSQGEGQGGEIASPEE